MQIVNIKVDKLKPYNNNPRYNDDAVQFVANSIKEFGFKVPIVVDKNNVIVAGHTRYKASLELGLEEVPCIVADDLTDEQVKAFRLADNKVSEHSSWNFDFLLEELEDLDLDMEQFGFNIGQVVDATDLDDDDDDYDDDYAEKTQHMVENILNLAIAQYEGVGKYDIPEIKPVYELPPIKEWIGFNYVLSDREPEGKAVHFFIDDYQFERIWNDPYKYIPKLKQYACVASPDFSPYGDMPLVLQLFNHYRKHWVAKLLQENGVTVVPTIRCSTDARSKEWFLDGEPQGGVVLMSSMWSKRLPDEAKAEYKMMKETLKPCKVLIYGNKGDMGIEESDNVEYIQNFTRKRFDKD